MKIVILSLRGSRIGLAPSKEQIEKIMLPWFSLHGYKMSDFMFVEFRSGDAFSLIRLDGPESPIEFDDIISDFYRHIKGEVKDTDLAARFSGGIEVAAWEESRGYHRDFFRETAMKLITSKLFPKDSQ